MIIVVVVGVEAVVLLEVVFLVVAFVRLPAHHLFFKSEKRRKK